MENIKQKSLDMFFYPYITFLNFNLKIIEQNEESS